MSATLDVSHEDTSPLKAEPSNREVMSVTLDVSHEDTSPLKARASKNMCDMSVAAEVFHEDKSPLNTYASLNMPLMFCALDKSGASVALYVMYLALRNESTIELQDALPHWTSAVSFAALVVLPATNLWKSPDMETLYELAAVYVWTALLVWVVSAVLSPQSTV